MIIIIRWILNNTRLNKNQNEVNKCDKTNYKRVIDKKKDSLALRFFFFFMKKTMRKKKRKKTYKEQEQKNIDLIRYSQELLMLLQNILIISFSYFFSFYFRIISVFFLCFFHTFIEYKRKEEKLIHPIFSIHWSQHCFSCFQHTHIHTGAVC